MRHLLRGCAVAREVPGEARCEDLDWRRLRERARDGPIPEKCEQASRVLAPVRGVQHEWRRVTSGRRSGCETQPGWGSMLDAQPARHLIHHTLLHRLRAIGDPITCAERLATTAGRGSCGFRIAAMSSSISGGLVARLSQRGRVYRAAFSAASCPSFGDACCRLTVAAAARLLLGCFSAASRPLLGCCSAAARLPRTVGPAFPRELVASAGVAAVFLAHFGPFGANCAVSTFRGAGPAPSAWVGCELR